MGSTSNIFQHLEYLWDELSASQHEGDEVGLLIYRSNILGADLRVTNFGGGNTSCKTIEKDPLTGEDVEVMWIKGSGGDIGTLQRDGLAGLYVAKLKALKNIYRGLEFEDEMVALFYHCLFDINSKAPSIDTALHAFLPYKHIDHLHPDAAIAIAAAKDGEEIMRKIYGDDFAWIPWQRPGFDLGLKLEAAAIKNQNLKGLYLGGHGLFTWGETAHECYLNSLEAIEKASVFLKANEGLKRLVFGGEKITPLDEKGRKNQAASIAPVLRGLASSHARMIGNFSDDSRVLEFIDSEDLSKLASLGTSCPDHFLRTKIRPLILDLPKDTDLSDLDSVKNKIESAFEAYRVTYSRYYEDHKRESSPAMRDPNPVVILWPGVGMFTFAKNKQTARVAGEFYINAINVMNGAEAVSEYVSLPLQEAFDIEYWLLEEAKLKRQPKEIPMSRKVVLVTGGAGGIGKAIADKLAENGACVVITDVDEERAASACTTYKKDVAAYSAMDVTDKGSIDAAFKTACLEFGGVDIIVHSAGLAISKPLAETTDQDYDILMDVLAKGQFNVAQAGVRILRAQGQGGDFINIVSKNALMAGPNNVVYGAAKAAQAHMSRLLAAELGPEKIRVNSVNPDAVIEGSKIWEGAWAEGRAKAYNISVEELPAYYANRTLLKEIVTVEDIANAVFAYVGGLLNKSTGNMINVDGGISAAFVR